MPRTIRRPRLFERTKQRLLIFLRQNPVLSVTIMLAAIVATTTLLMHVLESDDTYHALWRSMVYIFSGIDIDPPETVAGRVTATIMLMAGVVVVSLLTGYIASEFTRLLSISHSIPLKHPRSRFQDHVILFGWSSKTKAILRELNHDYVQGYLRAPEFVVVAGEHSIDRGSEEIYRVVFHVRGHATDPDVLKRSDLRSPRGGGARVAVILSNPALQGEAADRPSLLSLLAIEHLYPEVISIVEVAEPHNVLHMQNAYADEVIAPSMYASGLLARTAEYPGLHEYISEVLALNPIAGVEPVSLVVVFARMLSVGGVTMKEAVGKLYRASRGLLIGRIHHGSIPMIADNPAELSHVIGDDELLVLIAKPQNILRKA